VLRVNLTSQFLCCRAVVPHMVKNRYGRIVNIASIAGKEGNPNAAAYGAEVHQYGSLGLDQAPMRIGEIDFAGLGRSVGAAGRTVRTLDDLDDLAGWLAGPAAGLYVADCRISTSVVAPHMREVQAARRIPADRLEPAGR
jgi:hypothetical protein